MHFIFKACLPLLMLMASCSSLKTDHLPAKGSSDTRLMQLGMNDPLEGFNRASFAVDRYLFENVAYPVTGFYNKTVPESGRRGINNFYSNIQYPIRLTSTVLQGKFSDAWHETKRFGINTTIGILGWRNSAKDKYGMLQKNEDLGQTFGTWGWDHQVYLYIPFMGPGSARDYIGKTGDAFLNPSLYYLPAYYGLNYNEFSFYVEPIYDILQQQYDAYELTRVVYSVMRKYETYDFAIDPTADDTAQTQTLRSIFATPEDSQFVKQSDERIAAPESFKAPLPYSFWKQDKAAPLVIVLPGLGGHRKGSSVASLAELAYKNGNHVISFSNTFNWEFIQSAPKDYNPGYIYDDSKMLRTAYRAILKDLTAEFGGELFTEKKLMGMSMGAWYALNMAAQLAEEGAPNELAKCIAINPPINLIQGLSTLDTLYAAPSQGKSPEEARQIIDSALVKALASYSGGLQPTKPLPFTDNEASYLIGLSFKFTLREMLLEAGYADELTTTKERGKAYQYLDSYTFKDYYERLVTPKLLQKGLSHKEINESCDLRNRLKGLQQNKGLYLVLSRNDFLLQPEQVQWFIQNFPNQHTIFNNGGHLGNTWQPKFKKLIQDKLQ